jgi:hypothetical protein
MLFGFVVYILGALLHLGHPDLLMANTVMSPVEISGFVGAADVLEEMIRNGSDAAVVGGADAAAPAHGVVMKHHVVAAWKNFHLVQTKLKFFNAAVIVVSM